MCPGDDNDSFAARRRERDRDEEKTAEITKKIGTGTAKAGSLDLGTDKLLELIQQAEPLIEQVNTLYNQFMSGAERLPPLERRKQLDQHMATIMMMSKPTPALKFRATTLQSKYITNRDRWDKLMKDLEDGKIKKIIPGSGGKRG